MITFRHYLVEFNPRIPTRRLPDQKERDDFVKGSESRFGSQFGKDGQFRPAYTKPGFKPLVPKRPAEQEYVDGERTPMHKPEPALPRPPSLLQRMGNAVGNNIAAHGKNIGRNLVNGIIWGGVYSALGIGRGMAPRNRGLAKPRIAGARPITGRPTVGKRASFATRVGSALGRGGRR